jgi:hypothetical protein
MLEQYVLPDGRRNVHEVKVLFLDPEDGGDVFVRNVGLYGVVS